MLHAGDLPQAAGIGDLLRQGHLGYLADGGHQVLVLITSRPVISERHLLIGRSIANEHSDGSIAKQARAYDGLV
ncbi:MAG: hypothetical protein ACOCXA_01415 [Planctomycetota bacterium]